MDSGRYYHALKNTESFTLTCILCSLLLNTFQWYVAIKSSITLELVGACEEMRSQSITKLQRVMELKRSKILLVQYVASHVSLAKASPRDAGTPSNT